VLDKGRRGRAGRDPGASTFDPHRVDTCFISSSQAKRSSSLRSARRRCRTTTIRQRGSPGCCSRRRTSWARRKRPVDRALGKMDRGPAARLRHSAEGEDPPGGGKSTAAVLREQLDGAALLAQDQRRPEQEAEIERKLGPPAAETYEDSVLRGFAAGISAAGMQAGAPSLTSRILRFRRVRQALGLALLAGVAVSAAAFLLTPSRFTPAIPGDEAAREPLFSGTLKANRDYDVADPDTTAAKREEAAADGLAGLYDFDGSAAETLQRRVSDAFARGREAIGLWRQQNPTRAARLQPDRKLDAESARFLLSSATSSGKRCRACSTTMPTSSWRTPGSTRRSSAPALRLARTCRGPASW